MCDEFKMFYSSGDAKGNHGVEVVLGPRASDKVISACYVDNRMMVVRLQGKETDIVLEIGLVIFNNISSVFRMIQYCAIIRSLGSLLLFNGDFPFHIRNYMLHSSLHHACFAQVMYNMRLQFSRKSQLHYRTNQIVASALTQPDHLQFV